MSTRSFEAGEKKGSIGSFAALRMTILPRTVATDFHLLRTTTP
jgi:hypothetical protein